ncbi:MAG TPA: carbonate dehydratase [Bacteriovoracaceae bacterium]|nr:carbonate dehydratase [Bacteriovoracaceae bacterium]
MDKIKILLLENKAWAQSRKDIDPDYYSKMAIDQKPKYLWIGCADSRVPPSEITNTDPGEMFVHRNIANLVVHTDTNLLSVLQYAVEVLKIPHIIVCGHYNCGGVRAALMNQSYGLIDNWVRNIKDTLFHHKDEIEKIDGEWNKVNKLVEINVVEQVKNVAHTAIVQKAWKEGQYPMIHGWVYDLNTGLLKQVTTITPESDMDKIYKYTF